MRPGPRPEPHRRVRCRDPQLRSGAVTDPVQVRSAADRVPFLKDYRQGMASAVSSSRSGLRPALGVRPSAGGTPRQNQRPSTNSLISASNSLRRSPPVVPLVDWANASSSSRVGRRGVGRGGGGWVTTTRSRAWRRAPRPVGASAPCSGARRAPVGCACVTPTKSALPPGPPPATPPTGEAGRNEALDRVLPHALPPFYRSIANRVSSSAGPCAHLRPSERARPCRATGRDAGVA
jgi:hypothetical protein